MKTITVRNIPIGDLELINKLVGHLGHTSQSDVIRKAVKAYIRLHAKELKKIENET